MLGLGSPCEEPVVFANVRGERLNLEEVFEAEQRQVGRIGLDPAGQMA